MNLKEIGKGIGHGVKHGTNAVLEADLAAPAKKVHDKAASARQKAHALRAIRKARKEMKAQLESEENETEVYTPEQQLQSFLEIATAQGFAVQNVDFSALTAALTTLVDTKEVQTS
jgi:hypothetical protein